MDNEHLLLAGVSMMVDTKDEEAAAVASILLLPQKNEEKQPEEEGEDDDDEVVTAAEAKEAEKKTKRVDKNVEEESNVESLMKMIRQRTPVIDVIAINEQLNQPMFEPTAIRNSASIATIRSLLPELILVDTACRQRALYVKYLQGCAYMRLEQVMHEDEERHQQETLKQYLKRCHKIANSTYYHAIDIAKRCIDYGYGALAQLNQPVNFYKKKWPFEVLAKLAKQHNVTLVQVLPVLFEESRRSVKA
jgi:hypothetical protein